MSPNFESEIEIVGEHLRHYENLFFAHFAAFITVTAGLATAAFQNGLFATPIPLFAKGFGVVFTFACWLNATAYLMRMYALLRRHVELEEHLSFNIWKSHPEHRLQFFARFPALRPGGLSWHVLFLIVFAFWVMAVVNTYVS